MQKEVQNQRDSFKYAIPDYFNENNEEMYEVEAIVDWKWKSRQSK